MDGTLNIAGRDVHNTYIYNASLGSEVPRFPPGWENIENQRQIHIATLGKATEGTGLWIRQIEGWGVWLDPKGYLQVLWGYGMRELGFAFFSTSLVSDTYLQLVLEKPSLRVLLLSSPSGGLLIGI